MKSERELEGKFALITGGSRGIGRAIAENFARSGCNVALASRNAEQSSAAAGEIGVQFGIRTLGLSADVSKQTQVREMFRAVCEWSGGRLDVLVNNAGYPFDPTIWHTPLDATPADELARWYRSVFETDTLGSVYCTFEALPLMKSRSSGSILYISSTSAMEGLQGTPYTVAKAAILGLMKDVACEYGPYGIRANALALGSIRTPTTFDQLSPEIRNALAEQAPLRRWGNPGEIGRVAVFLASEASSFITGQTIVVDGGSLRH